MLNRGVIRERLYHSGLRQDWLAARMGLCKLSLSNRLQGKTEFKASELDVLCRELKLTPKEIGIGVSEEQEA